MNRAQTEKKLIHTFSLPLDKAGRTLWRVDFTPNYHQDIAKLRLQYPNLTIDGDVHTEIRCYA